MMSSRTTTDFQHHYYLNYPLTKVLLGTPTVSIKSRTGINKHVKLCGEKKFTGIAFSKTSKRYQDIKRENFFNLQKDK